MRPHPPGRTRYRQLVLEIAVADLGSSVAFYQRLGFKLERREPRFASLRWGNAELYLDQAPSPPRMDPHPPANVRVMVPDVDARWERARALGARVVNPIGDRYYGLRDFTIADPDGFGVRFASPLGRRRKP
jgi:catechol 2,3-dioxygenase-like lactoylglutathione lyase family enzyme